MRLTPKETEAIITALIPFLAKGTAELRLFGSRVDDQAKGGDIDLLLIVSNTEYKNSLLWQKPEILVTTKSLLGERRIDLKIAVKSELQSDPFLQIIYPKSVLLHTY